MTSSTPLSPRATRRQEGRPGGGVLGGGNVKADDLARSFVVDGRGDDRGDVDDSATLSHPLGQGIDPQVAVGSPVEGAFLELGHDGVELAGEPGDFGLGHALDTHGLDEVVDAPRGDPLDVGLADHRHQCLFGAPARVQQHFGAVGPPGAVWGR